MIFRSTSVTEVIGRVVRNTRLQDSSFIQDMFEWIPEAMGQLQTRMPLTYEYHDIEVHFHKGKMPCGLYYLIAVEYEGRRLPYSSTAKHYRTGHFIQDKFQDTSTLNTFTATVATEENEETGNPMWSTIWSQDNPPPPVENVDQMHTTHWYSTELDWVTTSIRDGILRLHYYAQPLDQEGMPLIPDNENYKEALYWYVRAKMIGAGFQDPVYKDDTELMQRFEVYGRRAINEITYPTPDQKEQQVRTQVRLIPPMNYWENFFRVDTNEPQR